MFQPIKFFDNIFESTEITDLRITNFAGDSLNRLAAQPVSPDYTSLINLLTPPYNAMQELLSTVDVAIGIQKGKTFTLNEFINFFKKTMSAQEGVIANAVGGFDTPAYMEFYPAGVSEYSAASKTNLPVLINRINAAATAHSAELGTSLTETLQSFEESWELVRSQQVRQKGNVDSSRTARSQARVDIEIALVTVVHTIGSMFPGDAEACMMFFDFTLLKRSAQKTQKEILTGSVASNNTVVAVIRAFNRVGTTKITNNSANASLFVYLAPTADAVMDSKGQEVKAGRSRNFAIDRLGDVNDTFLLVHNLSSVNDAGYILEIKN
jgi:hypothetical protein